MNEIEAETDFESSCYLAESTNSVDITPEITKMANPSSDDEKPLDADLHETLRAKYGTYAIPKYMYGQALAQGSLYKRNDKGVPDWDRGRVTSSSGIGDPNQYLFTQSNTTIPLNYAFKTGDIILITSSPQAEQPWQNVLVLHNNARARLYTNPEILLYWDLVSEPEVK